MQQTNGSGYKLDVPQMDRFLKAHGTLGELKIKHDAQQKIMEEINQEIAENMQLLQSSLPSGMFNHIKPSTPKKSDPENGRPFIISAGRKIVEAKKAGKTKDEARQMALDSVIKLAAKPKYQLAKPPQSALDRIELQLSKLFD